MSVVVKMEMPERCYDCQLSNGTTCTAVGGIFGKNIPPMTWIKRRPSWCPIICELPDNHERLVDASVAYDKIAEQEGGNYIDMDGVGMGLEETPTLVPAEGSEE